MRNIWWKILKQGVLREERSFCSETFLQWSKLRKLRPGDQEQISRCERTKNGRVLSGTQKGQSSGSTKWEQLSILRRAANYRNWVKWRTFCGKQLGLCRLTCQAAVMQQRQEVWRRRNWRDGQMFGWCCSHQTKRMILRSKEMVQRTECGLTLEPHSINRVMSPKEESGSQEGKNK